MREAIYSRYHYPNRKSRLKTWFLKLFPVFTKFGMTSLMGGEVWKVISSFQLGEDEQWIYTMEILEAEWCKQRHVLIIRELKM